MPMKDDLGIFEPDSTGGMKDDLGIFGPSRRLGGKSYEDSLYDEMTPGSPLRMGKEVAKGFARTVQNTLSGLGGLMQYTGHMAERYPGEVVSRPDLDADSILGEHAGQFTGPATRTPVPATDPLTQFAKTGGKAAREYWGEAANDPILRPRVDSYTDIKSIADGIDYASTGVGNLAGSLAITALAPGIYKPAEVAGVVGKEVVKRGLGGRVLNFLKPHTMDVPIGLMEGGEIANKQLEEQEKNGADLSLTRLIATAVPATLIERGLGVEALAARMGRMGPAAREFSKKNLVPRVLQGMGVTGLEEGAEEFVQTYLENYGGNPKSVWTKEALRDAINAGLQGMIGGHVMGGTGGAVASKQYEDVQAQQKAQQGILLNPVDYQHPAAVRMIEHRANIARHLEDFIAETDPELARAWGEQATAAIGANRPVDMSLLTGSGKFDMTDFSAPPAKTQPDAEVPPVAEDAEVYRPTLDKIKEAVDAGTVTKEELKDAVLPSMVESYGAEHALVTGLNDLIVKLDLPPGVKDGMDTVNKALEAPFVATDPIYDLIVGKMRGIEGGTGGRVVKNLSDLDRAEMLFAQFPQEERRSVAGVTRRPGMPRPRTDVAPAAPQETAATAPARRLGGEPIPLPGERAPVSYTAEDMRTPSAVAFEQPGDVTAARAIYKSLSQDDDKAQGITPLLLDAHISAGGVIPANRHDIAFRYPQASFEGGVTKEDVDEAAGEAASSPENDLPEPTRAQIEAGNYKKGHVSIQGLDISIENPKGSVRRGVSKDGKEWKSKLKAHYGYIRRTEGADGDHVDVFIGDNPTSQRVFVVDQVDPKTGRFDEHKAMVGYDNIEEARAGYLANYEPGWKGLGNMVPMSMDGFKAWLKKARLKRTVPEEQVESSGIPEPGDFYEFDIKAHPVRGPHTARFRVNRAYVTPQGDVIPLVEDFTNERGGGLYPIFPTHERLWGARLVKPQEGIEPGFFPMGQQPQEEAAVDRKASEPIKTKPAKSLIRVVIDMGGLSAAKVKAAGFNVKEDFQQHGLSFIFRKNGRSLDDIATELVSKGDILPGPDTIPSDNYVLSLLQAAARGQKTTVNQMQSELNVAITEQKDDILELREDLERHGADESQIEDVVRSYQDATREDTRPEETDRDAEEARARGDETRDDDVFVSEVEEPTETPYELRPAEPSEEGTALTPAEDEKRAQAPQGEETGGELFDTSGMFSLSGNQPHEQKTMKVAEKKGERMFDVEKQDVDELKERLSGEKAKREHEEEGKKEKTSTEPGRIEDFGEKIGGARKDQAPSLSRDLTDDDIATQPLNKIWPADEINAIDDKFPAAWAYAARSVIPAKPRVGYKVKAWVEKVKSMRTLAKEILDVEIDPKELMRRLRGRPILNSFGDKVELLASIDRDQWQRIGHVEAFPKAYYYDKEGKKVESPFTRVEIDGRWHEFRGARKIADALPGVEDLLAGPASEKKMRFEIRTIPRSGEYFINKKGDREYRKLKTFSDIKDARAYMKENYNDLVAAWEAVKEKDNVKETDVRAETNRPRTAVDRRGGKDVTPEQFGDTFGFRGVEFGNWVGQGTGSKERQGMLNQAYDALMDLAEIIGIQPKAISLNGSLGLAFGSRGSGWASAHFEPDRLVINLTKPRGAGSLAHEWFHALDNYFSRMRSGEVKVKRGFGADEAYRAKNFITYHPEPLYVHKTERSTPTAKARLEQLHRDHPTSEYLNPDNWQKDPKHPQGVRPEVEKVFAELVATLDASPMAERSRLIDKAQSGYWSRILERAARAFENYVINKMMQGGYHNDYLANVRDVENFPRSEERYPYLLPEEIVPVAEAFDNLFSTIESKETDRGVLLFKKERAREAQTRTPEFKRWFGDWEVVAHPDIEVTELAGNEISGTNPKEARKNATEYLKRLIDGLDTDIILNERTGFDIQLKPKQVKHGFQHKGKEQVYSVPAMVDLIRRADKIATNEHRPPNPDIPYVHTFVAPLRIDGQMFAVKLTVKEYVDMGKKFYDHEALKVEELAGISGTASQNETLGSRPAASSKVSIAHLLTAFKKEDLKYVPSRVVDENGEPLVVYHGTSSAFESFRPWSHFGTRQQANVIADEWGPGGNTIPVYLNIRNPLRMHDTGFIRPDIMGVVNPPDIFDRAELERLSGGTLQDWEDAIRRKGYDGIVYSNTTAEGPGDSYIAFSPTQIKSVYNRGTWNPEDDRISFTRQSDSSSVIEPAARPRHTVEKVEGFLEPLLRKLKNIGEVKVVQSVAEIPGVDAYELSDQDTVYGAYDRTTDTTYIVADSVKDIRNAHAILIHEVIGHRGVEAVLNEDEQVKVMQAAVDAYEGTDRLNRIVKDYDLDLADRVHRYVAGRELIAHMAESGEKPTVMQRIIGVIRDALRRLNFRLKWTDTDIKNLIRKGWEYSEGAKGLKRSDGDGQVSFKKDMSTGPDQTALRIGKRITEEMKRWKGVLSDYFNHTLKGQYLPVMMNTPQVLRLHRIGMKDLPMAITADTLTKAIGPRHSLTRDLIEQLPIALTAPIMVLKSATEPDSFVVMTEAQDNQGRWVIVPVKLNFPVGTIGAHVNKITSIYGRENNALTGKPEWFIDQIKAGNLVYMDKEKALRWSTSARLQLPLEETIKNLKYKIHSEADIVKPKFGEGPSIGGGISFRKESSNDLHKIEEEERGLNALLSAMEGKKDMPAALRNPDLGDVTLYYGGKEKDEGGLLHIVAQRAFEGSDDIAGDLVGVIKAVALGTKTREYGGEIGRADIEYGDYVAILSKSRFTKKETWLLTGFKKKEEGVKGESYNPRDYAQLTSGSLSEVVASLREKVAEELRNVKKGRKDISFRREASPEPDPFLINLSSKNPELARKLQGVFGAIDRNNRSTEPLGEPTKEIPDPKDDSDKKTGSWLNRETAAIFRTIATVMPGRMPHNSFLENVLKSPEWYSHPVFKNIVRLFTMDRERLYHTTLVDLVTVDGESVIEETDRLRKENPQAYRELLFAIDYGDTKWKRGDASMERLRDPDISEEARAAVVANQVKKYETYLREKRGVSDEAIRVWKLHRASYDKALDMMTSQLRALVAQMEEGELSAQTKTTLKELRFALASMQEWRGFYAPRLRERASWAVQAEKVVGGKTERYREHRNKYAAERLADRLRKEGWTDVGVTEISKLPESVYQNLKAVDVARAIKDASAGLKGEAAVTFNDELIEQVSNMIKSRGFRSSMIHRGSPEEMGVVRGYMEDPLERFATYVNNLAGGFSKAQVAHRAMEQLLGQRNEKGQLEGGIDPRAESRAYVTAERYIAEQLRNLDHTDRIVGVAKSIATFKYLGFNPRSMLVNMTAMVTTAPAAIHQYVMGGKGSMTRILTAVGQAGADIATVMAGRKLKDADEQAFIDRIQREGYDDPQLTRDAMGSIDKIHRRLWSKAMTVSMWMFGKTEQWNRMSTMLAGYRLARASGKNEEEAYNLALDASNKAHGLYGRSTLPSWAQGGNPAAKVGQLMYVYGKFSHNYLQMMYDLGFKKHDVKAFLFGFASPIVLAGGAAWPLKDLMVGIINFFLKLFGFKKGDAEKYVYDSVRQHLGKRAELVARHGLTGLAGIDISGSLSIGVGVPKSMWELTGAVGGIYDDAEKSLHYLMTGQPARAVEKVLPTGLANPVRAVRENTRGVTSEKGRPLFNDQTGRHLKLSTGQAGLRAAGFRPSEQAVMTERKREHDEVVRGFTETRNGIYEEARAYFSDPNRDSNALTRLMKKQAEYNQSIRDAGLAGIVPFMKYSNLKDQGRNMEKPKKSERRRFQQLQ